MKYVPIFCETKRQRDMEPRGPRGGRPLLTSTTGRAYAERVEGEWRCTCCRQKVSVAW